MSTATLSERDLFPSKASFRSSLIFFSTSSILYYQHMEINNNVPDVESQKPIDSSQLLYKENIEVEDLVRTATDKLSPKKRNNIYIIRH